MAYNNKQLLFITSQQVSWAFLIIWAEPSEVHTYLCEQFGGFADLGRVVSHVLARLTQLFSTCSLTLPTGLFTGRQKGSKRKAKFMKDLLIPVSEKV